MATSASTLRSSADRTVQALARVIVKLWFRSVETEGMDQITRDRPVLICANPANGFVDPVVLIATSPRPVRFLAKSTLWNVPGRGPLLDGAGVLPVYRQQDGDTSDNTKSFSACEAELAVDGVIGIFPEGTVNDTLRLLPLRTGGRRVTRSGQLLDGLRQQRAAVVTAVDAALGAPARSITGSTPPPWPRPIGAPVAAPAPPERP